MLITGMLVASAACIAAFVTAELVRRNAVRLRLVQSPDARSSHTHPTPTGGGIGIVVGGTIGAIAATLALPTLGFVVAISLAVAAIGLLDDRRPIAAPIRLGAQLLLVGAMVWLTVPAPSPGGVGIAIVAVIAAVYWLNLFNFMDGIDGIAGAQATFMLLGGALLAVGLPDVAESPVLWWMVALGTASLGFVALNWPPAKIFMGDAGSTYLGLLIAFFALYTIGEGWLTLWQWLILGAVFVLDATLTLGRRLWRREPIFRAHRLHGYQHLARRWGRHRPVTLLVLGVNVFWLLPLAWWAGASPDESWLAAGLALVSIFGGLIWAGAGAPEGEPGRPV